MASDLDKPNDGTERLLHSLRELIQGARQKVLRAVDAVQVQTCWEIGCHIVEFEQGGAARAEASADFGRVFDKRVRARFRCVQPAVYAVVLPSVIGT